MNRNTACVVWPVIGSDDPEAHVTILFLGEVVDKPDVFAQVVECLNSIQIPEGGEVKVAGLEIFGTPGKEVIVATLREDQENLSLWNDRLESALSLYGIKNGSAFKNYTPHVTLGRTIPDSLPERYILGSPELWWGDYKLILSDFGIGEATTPAKKSFPSAPAGVDVTTEVERYAPPAKEYALPPVSKAFSIWSEGYAANEGKHGAIRLGVGYGETFDDAVRWLMNTSSLDKLSFTKDDRGWKYWGCRLFDNEWAARKSFG